MALDGRLVAEIKISKFFRWFYMPFVKIRAKVTGREPDMEKVMSVAKKHTTITLIKGIRDDSGNTSQRGVH